jgi:hypothetical protein
MMIESQNIKSEQRKVVIMAGGVLTKRYCQDGVIRRLHPPSIDSIDVFSAIPPLPEQWDYSGRHCFPTEFHNL